MITSENKEISYRGTAQCSAGSEMYTYNDTDIIYASLKLWRCKCTRSIDNSILDIVTVYGSISDGTARSSPTWDDLSICADKAGLGGSRPVVYKVWLWRELIACLFNGSLQCLACWNPRMDGLLCETGGAMIIKCIWQYRLVHRKEVAGEMLVQLLCWRGWWGIDGGPGIRVPKRACCDLLFFHEYWVSTC